MYKKTLCDYDCEIHYHPGKANVVADALSWKERLKPKRVRAMNMILQSGIKDRILTAQKEDVDEFVRLQKGLDEMMEQRINAKGIRNSFKHEYGLSPLDRWSEKYCSPIMWAEVGQKSYADKRRKPLEFSVGDYVLLKVSPWKGVVRFRKKGKLEPRFVGPFEIIEKVGPVAYRLDFPKELNGVHDTFHMSNLVGLNLLLFLVIFLLLSFGVDDVEEIKEKHQVC
nr:hypothetical protein [Tanacetum cinerariifolium]